MTNQIFRRLNSTSQMMIIFDDESILKAMLDFEKALALAQVRSDMFEPSVADSIAKCCLINNFSTSELSESAKVHGTIVVPLIKHLTKLVMELDVSASNWVHFGATSQDVIDTAMVIQLRKALKIMERDVKRLTEAMDRLANDHGEHVMIGRTLLQPSVPITFAQKVLGWKSSVIRNWKRIEESTTEAFVLQFGGASGNLSSLDSQGLQVREALSEILELTVSDEVWHAHRDRHVALCSSISILVGGLGKIALDLSLLMQAEVGEISEKVNPNRGRSSAMPHKRNPVNCLIALAAAKRVPHLQATLLGAMPQEHERALGGWQVEWVTIPAIFETAAGAISAMGDMCDGLQIHPEKMAHNLDTLKGLFMSERIMVALSKKIGREKARGIIEEACSEVYSQDKHLADILKSNDSFTKEIGPDELDKLMNVNGYLGTPSKGN